MVYGSRLGGGLCRGAWQGATRVFSADGCPAAPTLFLANILFPLLNCFGLVLMPSGPACVGLPPDCPVPLIYVPTLMPALPHLCYVAPHPKNSRSTASNFGLPFQHCFGSKAVCPPADFRNSPSPGHLLPGLLQWLPGAPTPAGCSPHTASASPVLPVSSIPFQTGSVSSHGCSGIIQLLKHSGY